MKESLFHLLQNGIWSYMLIPIFIILSIYFTYKSGFVQFRYIRETLRSLFEKTPSSLGVSPLQAFSLSMGSRVGAGNVIGVAFAISVGGPGSIFWMWCFSFLGMAIVFVENTLSQVYKVRIGHDFQGGPAHYIKKGLKSPKLAACMAVLLIIIFGFISNSINSKMITSALNVTYSEYSELIMIAIIAVVILIVMGGIRRIVHVTEILVPLMLILYLGVIFYVLALNYLKIPTVFYEIITSAFGGREFMGGALGVALIEGVRSSVLTNETGIGSASIAGATANTRNPVKQGLIQGFGVFLDTMIISSGTAFVILLSGVHGSGIPNGILLVQASMSIHIGVLAPYFVSSILIFFSITSLIAHYYYGEVNVVYLSRKKRYIIAYRLGVLTLVLLSIFINDLVLWSFVSIFMGAATILNLVCILLLSGIAFKVLDNYRLQKRSGEVPYFYAEDIPGIEGAECWQRDESDEEIVNDAYFKAMSAKKER